MPRLIWVFAGRIVILFVLSCGGSFSEYLERPSFAFSAYWLRNHDAVVGDTLIFKNTVLNEHGVYNSETGEYTVKVNGTYIFLSTLCFHGGKYANLQFVADDRVIGVFRIGDESWDLCTSSSAVAYLQKDSKVKLLLKYIYKGSVFRDKENSLHCSFSGHLIK